MDDMLSLQFILTKKRLPRLTGLTGRSYREIRERENFLNWEQIKSQLFDKPAVQGKYPRYNTG